MGREKTPDENNCEAIKTRRFSSTLRKILGKFLVLSGSVIVASILSPSVVTAQNAPNAASDPKIISFAPEKNLTNQFKIPLKIKLSEPITGLEAEDISLNNAKVDFVTGYQDEYVIYVIPDSDGEVKASIKPNAFKDSDGNTNRDGASLTVVSDRTSPHFFKHIIEADEKNADRIRIKLNVTEPIVGFTIDDIVLTNTSGSDKVKLEDFSGEKDRYVFYIKNTGEPEIVFHVDPASFTDLAGNKFIESEDFFIGQRIVPVVVSFKPEKEITNSDIVPVSVKFSKDVTGFDTDDINTVGATPQNLTGSGNEYNLELVPTGDGIVTATILPGAVVDSRGVSNEAGKTLTATVDRTAPLIDTFTAEKLLTNAGKDPVQVKFSEPVNEFDAGDITLSNGAKIANFQKIGNTYYFDLEPGLDGPVTATIGAGAVSDRAGNTNPDTKALTVTFDQIDPSITLLEVKPETEGSDHLETLVKLSEPVRGFDANDIKLSGLVLDNFSGSGDTYRFFLTPLGTGSESITIDVDSFSDLAGNRNHEKKIFEISPSQITIDEEAPEVVEFIPAHSPNLENHTTIYVQFSEQIKGLDDTDIILTNGAVLDRISGSEDFYTLELTLLTEKTDIEILADSFTDLTGNKNTKPGKYSVEIESRAPEIISVETVTQVTNLKTIPVTLVFSELVEGFTANDIKVPEGVSLKNFEGYDDRYNFDIIPSTDGIIKVEIPEESFTDHLSLFNGAATNFEVEVDYTPPSVTLAGTPFVPGSPYNIFVTFSEPITELNIRDFDIQNASISEIIGSGSEYILKITPNGLEHSISLPKDRVADLAGNRNTASGLKKIKTDTTESPTIAITGLPSVFQPEEDLEVTFTFVDPQKKAPVSVIGFTTEDLRVTNGEVTNLAGSGAVYKAKINPSGKGNLIINVEKDAAHNREGQGSLAATAMSRLDSRTVTGRAITNFLSTRARNLVQLQPELVNLLTERKRFNFDASLKGKNFLGNIDVAQEAFWAWAAGASNKDESGNKSRYSLAAFGHFFTVTENLLLGTMVQVDNSHGIYGDNVEISGTGYLVGPYIVGKSDKDPIFYEARLLYGKTHNRISPFGTFTDKFSGHRWLVKVKVEGEYIWKAVTLRPAMSILHLHDNQHAYTDGLSNYISKHGIALSELDLGLKFETPLGDRLKRYRLVGGISGLWSQELGLGAAPSYIKDKNDRRVRLDAGLRYNDGQEISGSVGGFLDGLGTERRTHGMAVQLQIHF